MLTPKPFPVLVPVLALVLAASGCSQQADASSSAPAPAVDVADLEQPAAEDVVLTVRGGASNSDDGLQLSLEQIESIGTVEVSVYEPFVDEDITFTAVPWETVLELADLPEDVETLHTVAYNEYEVDIPVSVGDSPGAYLATRADGEPIPVADGGPTRVVFTDEHPEHDDESLWIWSIAVIEPA